MLGVPRKLSTRAVERAKVGEVKTFTVVTVTSQCGHFLMTISSLISIFRGLFDPPSKGSPLRGVCKHQCVLRLRGGNYWVPRTNQSCPPHGYTLVSLPDQGKQKSMCMRKGSTKRRVRFLKDNVGEGTWTSESHSQE